MSVPPGTELTDLERAVGRVLRLGITATTVCLAAGLLLSLLGASHPAELFLETGLVLLLATPVARVVVSVVDYARERDWLFVVLTIVVLLQLAGSVIAAVIDWRA
jgi:uncharacterized membrane protein